MRDREFRDALTRASAHEVVKGQDTQAVQWDRWSV